MRGGLQSQDDFGAGIHVHLSDCAISPCLSGDSSDTLGRPWVCYAPSTSPNNMYTRRTWSRHCKTTVRVGVAAAAPSMEKRRAGCTAGTCLSLAPSYPCCRLGLSACVGIKMRMWHLAGSWPGPRSSRSSVVDSARDLLSSALGWHQHHPLPTTVWTDQGAAMTYVAHKAIL